MRRWEHFPLPVCPLVSLCDCVVPACYSVLYAPSTEARGCNEHGPDSSRGYPTQSPHKSPSYFLTDDDTCGSALSLVVPRTPLVTCDPLGAQQPRSAIPPSILPDDSFSFSCQASKPQTRRFASEPRNSIAGNAPRSALSRSAHPQVRPTRSDSLHWLWVAVSRSKVTFTYRHLLFREPSCGH